MLLFICVCVCVCACACACVCIDACIHTSILTSMNVDDVFRTLVFDMNETHVNLPFTWWRPQSIFKLLGYSLKVSFKMSIVCVLLGIIDWFSRHSQSGFLLNILTPMRNHPCSRMPIRRMRTLSYLTCQGKYENSTCSEMPFCVHCEYFTPGARCYMVMQ